MPQPRRQLPRLLALCGLAAVSLAQLPSLPRAELRPLERAAEELARAGCEPEAQQARALLVRLGLKDKDLVQFDQRLAQAAQKGKARSAPVDKVVPLVQKAAQGLGQALPRQPEGPQRTELARIVLALDADQEAAHLALGHERTAAGFGPAGSAARQQRALAVQRAIQAARRLPTPIQVEVVQPQVAAASPERLLGLTARVLGKPFVTARFANVLLCSDRSPEQTRRILEQAARTYAFLRWCRTGELSLDGIHDLRITLTARKGSYEEAVDEALAAGWFDATRAGELRLLSSGSFDGRTHFGAALSEQHAMTILVYLLHEWQLEPACLEAGLCSYGCRAVLGLPGPTVAAVEERSSLGAGTSSSALPAAERSRLLRLFDAGLLGSRSYLRSLAVRGEDPKWRDTMLPWFGELQGEVLLKAASVAEFLVEEDRVEALNLRGKGVKGAGAAALEQALGEPLAAFETRWREWLLGPGESILQRLSSRQQSALAKGDRTALDALDRIRSAAFAAKTGYVSEGSEGPLAVDPDLSRGCLLHARYLAAHPERGSAWPDAHEELPEHQDWTAAGCWAGSRSVIAPGAPSMSAAVDQWLGSFFHRLPLLDPGLVCVGLAHEQGIAVLDSGSMVRPPRDGWHVAWPYDGMKKTPLGFVPELPNPVPGQDQAGFGYPVTLQLGLQEPQASEEPRLEMELRLGGADGRAVDCWFVSPQAPHNLEHAPAGAFALIPKAPLLPGKTYWVSARWLDGTRTLVWTFST